VRWKETVEILTENLIVLIGDIFVSGASVSYYGPFTGVYRENLVKQWLEKCQELGILCRERYSLQAVLGDPV